MMIYLLFNVSVLLARSSTFQVDLNGDLHVWRRSPYVTPVATSRRRHDVTLGHSTPPLQSLQPAQQRTTVFFVNQRVMPSPTCGDQRAVRNISRHRFYSTTCGHRTLWAEREISTFGLSIGQWTVSKNLITRLTISFFMNSILTNERTNERSNVPIAYFAVAAGPESGDSICLWSMHVRTSCYYKSLFTKYNYWTSTIALKWLVSITLTYQANLVTSEKNGCIVFTYSMIEKVIVKILIVNT